MKLFEGLVKPNSTVRIEILTTSRGTSGGQIESYTTLADGVPAIVTNITAVRDGRQDGTDEIWSGDLFGNHSGFSRGDVRYFFTSGPAAGRYAKVVSAVGNGPGGGVSMIEKFYRSQWEQVRPVG